VGDDFSQDRHLRFAIGGGVEGGHGLHGTESAHVIPDMWLANAADMYLSS
jgi:hypothetical protein